MNYDILLDYESSESFFELALQAADSTMRKGRGAQWAYEESRLMLFYTIDLMDRAAQSFQDYEDTIPESEKVIPGTKSPSNLGLDLMDKSIKLNHRPVRAAEKAEAWLQKNKPKPSFWTVFDAAGGVLKGFFKALRDFACKPLGPKHEPELTSLLKFLWRFSFSIATAVILIGMFALEVHLGGGAGASDPSSIAVMYEMGAFAPFSFLLPEEWPRMFLSSLLHADIEHLAVNLLLLFPTCCFVEYAYGKVGFVLTTAVSIVTSTVVQLLGVIITNDFSFASGGASDLAFGMAGAALLTGVVNPRALSNTDAEALYGFLCGYAFLAFLLGIGGPIAVYFLFGESINIGIPSHAGGLIGGVLAALMMPNLKLEERIKQGFTIPVAVRVIVAALWLVAMAVVFAYWIEFVQPIIVADLAQNPLGVTSWWLT